MEKMTTQEIVLECAEALELAKAVDPMGTIDLLPYFKRVIQRVVETTAALAEEVDREGCGEIGIPCGCGREIARRIREKAKPKE